MNGFDKVLNYLVPLFFEIWYKSSILVLSELTNDLENTPI